MKLPLNAKDIDDSVFYLDGFQTEKFHNQFKPFYFNKMASRVSKSIPEIFTYCPKLSEGSVKIIQNCKRQNLHEEYLRRETSLLEKVSRAENELNKICTFRPKVNTYKLSDEKNMRGYDYV